MLRDDAYENANTTAAELNPRSYTHLVSPFVVGRVLNDTVQQAVEYKRHQPPTEYLQTSDMILRIYRSILEMVEQNRSLFLEFTRL